MVRILRRSSAPNIKLISGRLKLAYKIQVQTNGGVLLNLDKS